MKNKSLEQKLSNEIIEHIDSRKTLFLSSIDAEGFPYASYAPFAHDGEHLWVLLSEIAIHGHNLAINPKASVLIVEDEDTAAQLFARKRVSYQIEAELINLDSEEWKHGIKTLTAKQGERIENLSQLTDFKLFRLKSLGGRYVKGFGKAYTISGNQLSGESLSHLMEGHKKRTETAA